MDKPNQCMHLNFRANVEVNRVLKNEDDTMPWYYTADIRVNCADCGLPFEFVGDFDCGLMPDRATVDPSAQELRVPLRPKGLALLPGIPGFTVRVN